MTPPSAEDRAREIADQYYTAIDGKLVLMKGMFPMAGTAKDRARVSMTAIEINNRLRCKCGSEGFFIAGTVEGEMLEAGDMVNNIECLRCHQMYYLTVPPDTAALLAHGLTERRAGIEMAAKAVEVEGKRLKTAGAILVAEMIRALPLPGDDR